MASKRGVLQDKRYSHLVSPLLFRRNSVQTGCKVAAGSQRLGMLTGHPVPVPALAGCGVAGAFLRELSLPCACFCYLVQ